MKEFLRGFFFCGYTCAILGILTLVHLGSFVLTGLMSTEMLEDANLYIVQDARPVQSESGDMDLAQDGTRTTVPAIQLPDLEHVVHAPVDPVGSGTAMEHENENDNENDNDHDDNSTHRGGGDAHNLEGQGIQIHSKVDTDTNTTKIIFNSKGEAGIKVGTMHLNFHLHVPDAKTGLSFLQSLASSAQPAV